MMRTVVFVAVLIVAADAISFQDLVDRAEEADHPHPKKAAPRVLAPTLKELGDQEEAQNWSTEHLLGLDQPAPTDLFSDLEAEIKPKKKVRAVKKVAKVVPKKVVKAAAPKPASSPADIVPEDEEDEVSPSLLLHPTRSAVKTPPSILSLHASIPKPPQDAKPKEYKAHAHMLAPHDLLKKHVAPLAPELDQEDEQPTTVGSYVSNLFSKVEKKSSVQKAHKVAKATKKIVHHLETVADSKPTPKPAQDMLRGLSRSMLVDQDNRVAQQDAAKKAEAKREAGLKEEQQRISLAGEEATEDAPLPELDLDAGEDDSAEDDEESPAPKKEIPKLGDFLDVDSGSEDDDFLVQTMAWSD